ncbi:Heat stress transcription factor A-1 [Citrus sinensis]|nr:Heat stress transcription factor A-1 [Citrus sinensis]
MESMSSSSAANGNSLPPFLSKIYDMVEDPSTNDIVSWSSSNNSFIVWKVAEFSRDLLPKYFKHSNFSSFVRQLNTYGFRKVDPDRYEFANEGFLRGQKHLLKSISRRKPAQVHGQQQPKLQNSSVGACVEVGKYGLEEEVEILKRDKNVLMQELVRLRQQQQATDRQLHTVGQRVQVMEQRQQQMMSFLAKAMHSPSFLSQLVQQQNDSNRHISGSNKKRRLPRQDEENTVGAYDSSIPNGQIVKFQPSMNEAAKAMLHQIMKMNSPSRLEPTMSNLSTFLIDNIPSANALENGHSSSQISGVTLSEVPPNSGQSNMSTESRFHVPSSAISEIQCSPCVSDSVKVNPTQEKKNLDPTALDGTMSIDADAFSPDHDVDVSPDGIHKLPRIDDAFWEEFLTASPLPGDTDEINSSPLESGMTSELEQQPEQANGWDNFQHMDHLTEQMGLLTSESRRL